MKPWNLTDPTTSGEIAAEFERIKKEGNDALGHSLVNSLMTSVRTIVVGISLSYSPEHCEGSDETYCSAPEQHYPWSLLRSLADMLEEIDTYDSFDEFRRRWWAELEKNEMEGELENFPTDFSPEDFLNFLGGGEESAESE